MTYFLGSHEGTWYYPGELKQAITLPLDEQTLRKELELLYKYDIIEKSGGRYGGVFDRTLKKVLMRNYGDILNLPVEEFEVYFKNVRLGFFSKHGVEKPLECYLTQHGIVFTW